MNGRSGAERSRTAGLLLHPTSLPGPYGIGDLGPTAHAFVNALSRAKQTWWQMLPLGPPAAANSPYKCFSAFAGNPLLISPDLLVKDGLLAPSDVRGAKFPAESVDYARVAPWKEHVLSQAWARSRSRGRGPLRAGLGAFRRRQSAWLGDFALFMALREAHGGAPWTEWPRDLVARKPEALRRARAELSDAIGRHEFVQFLFFRQLEALKAYARERGVRLIGDLPIFVSEDSSDVWANPGLFLLDRHYRPRVVAGVPPDYFSASGQRWGNPLYDWRAMARDGFAWWVARFRAAVAHADLVRIDHFRGFAAFWAVPADEPTARHGRWVKAPGHALLETVRRKLGGLPFIAEDLGEITPDVHTLRDEFGLPGMRILQFAFGGDADSPFLPHNYPANAIAYTGTHDNDTTRGWYESLDRKSREFVRRYAALDGQPDVVWPLIRLAWSSVAEVAIAPLQDVLDLGSDARMNVPGRGEGNWRWRFRENQLTNRTLDRLADLTNTYARSPRDAPNP